MSELDVTEAIEAVRDALYRGEGKDLPAGRRRRRASGAG